MSYCSSKLAHKSNATNILSRAKQLHKQFAHYTTISKELLNIASKILLIFTSIAENIRTK